MDYDIVEIAITGFFVALIPLYFPWRREREFVLRATIAASPDRIREAYRIDPANPYSARAHPKATSAEWFDEARLVQKVTVVSSGGHGTNLATGRSVTPLDEPPWRLLLRHGEGKFLRRLRRICESPAAPAGPPRQMRL